MRPIAQLPDSALVYNAQDCYEAIQANPDNEKVPQYFAERRACLSELGRRARLRGLRKEVAKNLDTLTLPLKYRWGGGYSLHYRKEERRDAVVTLALLK